MWRWIVVLTHMGVAGCASQPDMKWFRTDGRSIPNDPALLQQADSDMTICLGEKAKVLAGGIALSAYDRQGAGNTVLRGCMAERGYVLRTVD